MPTEKERLVKEIARIMISRKEFIYTKRDWPHLKKELSRLNIETLEHLRRLKK